MAVYVVEIADRNRKCALEVLHRFKYEEELPKIV